MSILAAGSNGLPLDDDQTNRVQHALHGLSSAQLHWVSGYAAGIAVADLSEPAAGAGDRLTVLYGSQTGNGQAIAEALARRARDAGFAVNLENLANYKPASLKRESLIAVVISTHGEGDPPDDAELFHEFLLSGKVRQLQELRYSVLALGDSSYVNFCQTGREIDQQLAELGAVKFSELIECDLDYDLPAASWSDSILEQLPELLQSDTPVPHLRAVASTARYDKHRPFSAEVLVNQKITGAGSSKDVRHIELSLEGSGLSYEPGDALAVVAENPPALVAQFVDELGFNAETTITLNEEAMSINDALRSALEITIPSLGFLTAWADHSHSAELRNLLDPGQRPALSDYIDSHQIIDIIREHPADVDVNEFAASLRKLNPRSYSIASSQGASPDEVHLTVAAVRYEAFGTEHWGAASTHIVDRVDEGENVSVYIEPNPRFRLPADDVPIIMIGPGTGVAPFRAFVEERAERGASGENWLFFGDRNFCSDFLYQLEWQRHLKQGHLHRLDVAFSRDQQDKVYVQHRIDSRGAEIYAWLSNGAAIYVCGDAKQMAGDVHDALVGILVTHGGRTTENAEDELKALRRSGRYQRDVY